MFGKDVVVVFKRLTQGVVEVEPGSVGSVGRVGRVGSRGRVGMVGSSGRKVGAASTKERDRRRRKEISE